MPGNLQARQGISMVPYQYVVIVGAGRLGSILANQLSRLGSSVVVVDRDEAAFGNLSTEFSGFRITGDAAELSVLRRAKLDKADCVLVTTQHDNVNLMVTQVAKTVFHVPRVMARVVDPSREVVYHEFGIETICPAGLAVNAFLQALQGGPEAEPS
jgi:trk system potassium uptake protein TrkA